MNKSILFAGLVFISRFSFAQDDVAKATWVSSPVKADGKATEWTLPLNYYDADTKLFFAFANDGKNIYLCFQSPDETNQEKIMKAGMEITLGVKGKHKVSIDFPLGNASGSAHNDNNLDDDQYTDRVNRRDSFLLHDTMMEVKGFATREGLIPIHDSSGINAAINWDESNKLTYEIVIPLKELYGTNYSAKDISKDISMEITVNPLKGLRKASRAQRGGGSGMQGTGMGGRMGGGGMHHQRSTDNEDTQATQPGEDKLSQFEKSTLKQKFVLAESSESK